MQVYANNEQSYVSTGNENVSMLKNTTDNLQMCQNAFFIFTHDLQIKNTLK
jgi:hypothetical protein